MAVAVAVVLLFVLYGGTVLYYIPPPHRNYQNHDKYCIYNTTPAQAVSRVLNQWTLSKAPDIHIPVVQ